MSKLRPKKHVREVMDVVRGVIKPFGLSATLDVSRPGHPHVILSLGETRIGQLTLSNTPAVAQDEINYARQRTRRLLREAGFIA